MSDVMHFEPEDSYEIKGRGRVWTGCAPETSKEQRVTDWRGRRVEINGLFGTIIGVESWAVPRPVRAGDHVGLLVQFD